MLEVEDILPSPLTPFVLPPSMPESVCEMQTQALFKMAQSSPQPQSVDTANYARVSSLPSLATSSSSSGELHLYKDSETGSPSIVVGSPSSAQELLLQGNTQVPQPLPLFSTAHTAVSKSQPPNQPTGVYPPGLMNWSKQNSPAAPHQRPSSPTGNTLVGFVDHDPDRNHRYTHHP